LGRGEYVGHGCGRLCHKDAQKAQKVKACDSSLVIPG
jgi:hypothetical protein